MRAHDRQPNVADKLRKRWLSSKQKAHRQSLARSRWPFVAMSRGRKPHGSRAEDGGGASAKVGGCRPATVVGGAANDRDGIVDACDIVELLENGEHVELEERRTACPCSSNSMTDLDEEDTIDTCSTCKDCMDCRLEEEEDVAQEVNRGIEQPTSNHSDEELAERYSYRVENASEVASSREVPILVDLTREESKIVLRQTILMQHGAGGKEASGENAITWRKWRIF